MPFVLAIVSFLVYWPSLRSDFVYDARAEILNEGFITSLPNLPDILSLKVLSMDLRLADRPGQLLYLMLNAAIWGREPWGYHLSSNLLHAANVALLYILLRRLLASEPSELEAGARTALEWLLVAASLIFALHPIAVEAVSAVNYSSDLLVTFFTLLALLAATAFRPDNLRLAVIYGCAGVFCSFAAVTCKESGVAASLLLIVYWFLFRRNEAKLAWLCFLGASISVTAALIWALLVFPLPSQIHATHLGGSLSQVFWIQPRLWVFMMGQLLWPARLSADYVLQDVSALNTPVALVILAVVVGLQSWLALKSRVGGLGVAVYWLGLATVSNFIPLYRIMADRFYYLPLAGVAIQLLAMFIILLHARVSFWWTAAPVFGAIMLFTLLTLNREEVFANDFSLWSDTVRASPGSSTAHNNLCLSLLQKGRIEEAKTQCQEAIQLNPNAPDAHGNLGLALDQEGLTDEAISEFQKELDLDAKSFRAHSNLGNILTEKGELDEAIIQFRQALEINPNFAEGYYNLGNALVQKGQFDEAIIQYQKSAKLNPDSISIHYNLGLALTHQGRANEAVEQLQMVLRLNPNFANVQQALDKAEALLHATGNDK